MIPCTWEHNAEFTIPIVFCVAVAVRARIGATSGTMQHLEWSSPIRLKHSRKTANRSSVLQ